MLKHPAAFLGLLLAGLVAVAWCATGEPPSGVPDWAIILLGVALPWLYQTFMTKLPSLLRQPIAWLSSAVLAAALGFAFLGWRSIADLLRSLPWLIIAMEFVYNTLVKPLARAAAKRKSQR